MEAFLGGLARGIAEALHRAAVRRTMASLDGCEFCGEDGEFFINVTPKSRHITVRLACTPCAAEAVKAGAVVLMGSDGVPVAHG